MELACWRSCIGKGLHLQPAQQACSQLYLLNVFLLLLDMGSLKYYVITLQVGRDITKVIKLLQVNRITIADQVGENKGGETIQELRVCTF